MYIEDKYPMRPLMLDFLLPIWELGKSRKSSLQVSWVLLGEGMQETAGRPGMPLTQLFFLISHRKGRRRVQRLTGPSAPLPASPLAPTAAARACLHQSLCWLIGAWPAGKFSATVCCGGHGEKGGVCYQEPAWKIWATTPFLGHTAEELP